MLTIAVPSVLQTIFHVVSLFAAIELVFQTHERMSHIRLLDDSQLKMPFTLNILTVMTTVYAAIYTAVTGGAVTQIVGPATVLSPYVATLTVASALLLYLATKQLSWLALDKFRNVVDGKLAKQRAAEDAPVVSKRLRLLWDGTRLHAEGLTIGANTPFPLQRAQAVCHASYKPSLHGKIPGEECACGFYGFWSRKEADELRYDASWLVDAQFHGRTVKLKKGCRAQNQTVTDMYVTECVRCTKKADMVGLTEGVGYGHLPRILARKKHNLKALAEAREQSMKVQHGYKYFETLCRNCVNPEDTVMTLERFAALLKLERVTLHHNGHVVNPERQMYTKYQKRYARIEDARQWLTNNVNYSQWDEQMFARAEKALQVTGGRDRFITEVCETLAEHDPETLKAARWVRKAVREQYRAGAVLALTGGSMATQWERALNIRPVAERNDYEEMLRIMHGPFAGFILIWWEMLHPAKKVLFPLTELEQAMSDWARFATEVRDRLGDEDGNDFDEMWKCFIDSKELR